ncbi:DUF427 domain-containing protein [Methylorubrum populi]|jgi:uncharacterized protein (DUF427 family)|uniref:DUF427 domain-containing protein n=1 Tax=Methylorubrum rhodesianum TaxID=29427 RepID=A0ABU9Z4Z5_9HYPH|nr:DUF427 domain-containing protein [Methylorubrum rhodesianum]MBK3405136.1 DUF427 domain-containing protein [Methylorubrum rhodesianum]MBY0138730.1 DUF427 domain-containing protein [Methylorubrum populi]
MKEPGPAHPITITPHPGPVRIRLGGRVVAETRQALELREAGYGPVLYIPQKDVGPGLLNLNPRRSYCPYKGEASYFDLSADGAPRAAAAWSYENPYPAVARIRGHVAFYPDRVDAIEA